MYYYQKTSSGEVDYEAITVNVGTLNFMGKMTMIRQSSFGSKLGNMLNTAINKTPKSVRGETFTILLILFLLMLLAHLQQLTVIISDIGNGPNTCNLI